MNHTSLTLYPPKRAAKTSQENGEMEPEWMMWFPCNGQDLGGCFTNWIEQHSRLIEAINPPLIDLIKKWRRLLDEYVPPFPVNALVLTFHNHQTQIIPLKYKLLKGGISYDMNGWATLWKDLVFEPISRIVDLMPTYVRLYEVRHTDPELIIELPVDHQPRYKVLRDFLASVIRQYRKEPGPIVVRGMGSGIMELDCWILGGYFKIQTIWKLNGETSCGPWWQQMRRMGRVAEWIHSWSMEISEKAKRDRKYIEDEKEITSFIKKDRLDTLFLSKNNSIHFLNKLQLKEIVLKQLNVHYVLKEHIGAILK